MQNWVDIEGSGRNATRLQMSERVELADRSELSSLSIENSGSPTFSVDAVLGQSVQQGETTGVSFGANTGFFNDIDPDQDGILGTADLCPGEFAGCADVDEDGCIDVPDADADTDGVSAGSCDCNDSASSQLNPRPGRDCS